MDVKLRRSLSELRLISHKLAIEKGRNCRQKIAMENCLCIYCDRSNVEDEITSYAMFLPILPQ